MLAPGTLHVRSRHADADAELVLALDTRVDVGPDVGEWSSGPSPTGLREAGSLDAGARAISSIAASYLRQGDRVGFADLGRPQLSVKLGSGHRHLQRVRHQLVGCCRSAGWAPRPVLPPQQVPPGAVVVIFSPFLDDAVVGVAAHASRRGNVVLAVDLLPDPLVAARDSEWGEVVGTVLRIEHRLRLDTLREHGIPVVRWTDGRLVAETLRQVRRRVVFGR